MITLDEVSRLTNVRESGLKALIANGALPASRSGQEGEPVLTLQALAKLQELKQRCVREIARAFDRPTATMFCIMKSESYIFDVVDDRVVLDEESLAHLTQELLKIKKGGTL